MSGQPINYYGYNQYSSAQQCPYPYYHTQSPQSVLPPSYNQAIPPSSSQGSSTRSSNTLFVKNLPFEMSSDELARMFKVYGEIGHLKSHISDRGIAFLTFYDMRSAERAFQALHGTFLNGRQLVVDYSYKKKNKNNNLYSSYLIVQIIDLNHTSLALNELQNYMTRSFGEIFKIYEVSKGKFFIQFYDYRAAQNAARYGNSLLINNVRVNMYVPDDEPSVSSRHGNYHDKKSSLQQPLAPAPVMQGYPNYGYQQPPVLPPNPYPSYQQPMIPSVPPQPPMNNLQQMPMASSNPGIPIQQVPNMPIPPISNMPVQQAPPMTQNVNQAENESITKLQLLMQQK